MQDWMRAMTPEEAKAYLQGPNERGASPYELLQLKGKAKLIGQKLCPGCGEVPETRRQKKPRDHLCAWCGYDHDAGTFAGLVPA